MIWIGPCHRAVGQTRGLKVLSWEAAQRSPPSKCFRWAIAILLWLFHRQHWCHSLGHVFWSWLELLAASFHYLSLKSWMPQNHKSSVTEAFARYQYQDQVFDSSGKRLAQDPAPSSCPISDIWSDMPELMDEFDSEGFAPDGATAHVQDWRMKRCFCCDRQVQRGRPSSSSRFAVFGSEWHWPSQKKMGVLGVPIPPAAAQDQSIILRCSTFGRWVTIVKWEGVG